jgi:hypothetical protein
MFQKISTLSINLTTGSLDQSDPISARASLAITLTGIGSLVAGNMKAALYRLNRNGIDGTLVATCDTFTLSAGTFVGSMSLNTAEVVAAFTDLPVVREYEKARFQILIYDSSASVYMIWEFVDLSYEYPLAAGTPPAVSPITSATTTWGNFKLIGGVINIQSTTDGLWYPLTLAGAGTTIHEQLGETGIP